MPWLHKFRNAFRTERLSIELDRELAFHVAERTDELIANGMSESDALHEARKLFGNYSGQKERTRDMNIVTWLETAWGDLAYGWRQLRSNPGFTTVAVLSLALGIGANTAIFQLIDAIRLRGLPVEKPSELAAVDRPRGSFSRGWYSSRNVAFTYSQVESIRRNQQAFSDLLAFNDARFNLSPGGQPRYASGLYVTNNFLKVLGVKPIAGHDFAASGDRSCSEPGVLINHGFWQSEFAGSLTAIGKTISLDGHQLPVLGVLPSSFYGVEPGLRFDVALPLCAEQLFSNDGKTRLDNRSAWWLSIIGRLKPGWSVERASKSFHDIASVVFRESLPAEYRAAESKKYLANKLTIVSASAGVSSVRRDYENPLWILMGITGLVLLIACANLANLLLARASAREREIAVRQALGASRTRLIMQMLSESFLLALFGGLLGAGLAHLLSRTLVAFLSTEGDTKLLLPAGINWHVFAFTGLLALFTCLLFGLIPAVRASGATPANAMRGGRNSTATRERNGLRRSLVISQVALSLVLLVAALLFSRSLQKLFSTAIGFDSQNVLVASVAANPTAFPKADYRAQLFRELSARFDNIQGVSSGASVNFVPLGGSSWNEMVHADNDAALSGGKTSWFNRVGPGYFATMGTPLLAGRDFTLRDDTRAPDIALVNQTFAKQFFGGRNPVGRSFRVEKDAGAKDSVIQIVGLVGDTKYNRLREDAQPIAFFPVNQDKEIGTDRSFVFRVKGPIDRVSHAVLQQAAAVNPSLLVEVKVLDIQIRESVLRERLMANLTAGFGFLAACLSTLGLYGVMSYLVARRRNEIGIRLALGAARHNVFSLILRDAYWMVFIGLVVGLAGSLLLSRYAESLLYGLKGNDPTTLAISVGLLLLTALGATLFPARRAARLEPVAALREE